MAGITRSPSRPLATRVPRQSGRKQGRQLLTPAPAKPVKKRTRGRRK